MNLLFLGTPRSPQRSWHPVSIVPPYHFSLAFGSFETGISNTKQKIYLPITSHQNHRNKMMVIILRAFTWRHNEYLDVNNTNVYTAQVPFSPGDEQAMFRKVLHSN